MTTTTIASHYDRLAPDYERRWPRYIQAQLAWVMENWPETNASGIVLDLGCGSGVMLEAIHHRNPLLRMIGVDISPGMLAQAADRAPDATLVSGDLEDAVFTATLPHADTVLSLSILHHLHDIDAHLALLDHLVNQGGVVFLADFAVNGFVMRAAEAYFRLRQPLHQKALSQSQLRSRLNHFFYDASIRAEIVRPDRFWRIQMYRLSRT